MIRQGSHDNPVAIRLLSTEKKDLKCMMVGFNAIYNTNLIFIGFSKYFVGHFSHRTVKINSLLEELRVQQSRQS